MEIVSLVEYLVKNVVKQPDMVSVKKFDDDNEFIIEVMVDSEDMGAVIGKGGMTASAIRTLAQAAAMKQELPKVKINFDSF